MRPAPRRRDDGTALVEVSWLALLLMVPLVYVVLAVYDIQRHAFAVTAAARAAGRPRAAPDAGQGEARARAAAALALADQRVDADAVRLDLTCRPAGDASHRARSWSSTCAPRCGCRCSRAVLGDGAPSIRVDAAHTFPYGTFREDRS